MFQFPFAPQARVERLRMLVIVIAVALEGDETFDEETERMLLEAIAQCDRRQITPMRDLLDELRSRE